MTCLRTQSLITPFINDQLNNKDLEEFINHISSCSECKEELEVYFALLTAMKQLDEDKNLSDNYNMELSSKLQKSEDRIFYQKLTYVKKCGRVILIILLIAILTNFGVQNDNEMVVTKSIFKLRINYFERRYDIIGEDLETYLRWEMLGLKQVAIKDAIETKIEDENEDENEGDIDE